MGVFSWFGRPLFFSLDPEKAHNLALNALKVPLFLHGTLYDVRLSTHVAGLAFANPLGLAAGFDKNAEAVESILQLGFGFAEVGTVTPYAQSGNPKPRLFRLVDDEAIINRMGFNNEGHAVVLARLEKLRARGLLHTQASQSEPKQTSHAQKNAHPVSWRGIVGVNIGANKDSPSRIDDYVLGVKRFYTLADYFTVNISSPNTPGLRDLQAKEMLEGLCCAVSQARQEAQKKSDRHVPIFLKIAPDLTEQHLDDIAEVFEKSGLEGLIVANTTLDRAGLKNARYREEKGGLSGRPVFRKSTVVLAKMRKRLGPQAALIGVGGVCDCESFLEKIQAGADLVQLYSGMVFHGPNIAYSILKKTLSLLEQEGISHLRDYRDLRMSHWAAQSLQ